MAKDVIITPADGDIQFENSTGTEAGKIEQSGDDLVLSNAVGDILIGDGTSDVYIGDGAANVDIVFEQNGSIRGEAGSSVDITLGSSDTDVIISGSTFNIDPDASFTGLINANNKITFTTSNGYVLFDHQPQTGVGEYTSEVPLLKIDYDGSEKTILSRTTGGGAITIGADDSVVIAAGDTKAVIKTNLNLGAENVIFSSETGFHAYGFPNNSTVWSNRQEFRFYTGGTDTSLNGLWIGDGSNTQFIDLSRNLKNIGTISSGAITSTGTVTATNLSGTNTGDQDLSGYSLTSHNHDGRYLRTHTRYSDDLDTITTSGVYIWDVSEADDEPTGASDGILTIKYWDSTNWATANFQDFHTNKLYIKSKQSNTWQTDWARVWTTDQLSDTVKGQYDTAYTYSQVGHLPLAGGTLTGNLTVDIADDGGAPAMTSTLRLKGYEGRGAGIKIQDSVNSATSSSDREWFIGSGYSTSGFNIGYAGDGVQSSYAAQSFFDISTSGNAVFAGRVKGENFTSTENAAPGGFQASRDYLIAGTGDRGGGIVINDISGARYGFYAGGHDLTFAKETDDGAGTVSHDIWMRANATNGAGNVNSIEFFKESSFSGNVTIDGNVKPNLLELIDQNNSTSTADFRMYGWGTELQFTKRNLSTGAHTGTLLALDYTSNAATFLGAITASNFSGTSSGTNTGDQDLSGYLTSLPSHNHDDRYYTETEINENLASLQGWVPAYSNTEGSSVRWNFTEDALQIQLDTDTTTGASFKARRIISGERIRVTIMAKASAAASSGVYFRLYQHNGDMPDGKTHVSNDASNSSVLVQEDDAGVTSWHENSSITTDWVTYEKEYTAVADGYISLVILNWSDLGTNSLYIKNPDIQTIKAATAATVTTNANLTGHVTSVGNATSLGSFTTAELNAAISDGTINTPDLSGYLPLAAGSGSPLTGNLHIPDYLYHAGDTNTYLRFRAADDVELVAGGRNVIRMDEGTDPDKVQLGDSTTVTYTEGRLGIGTATPTQTDVGSIVPKLHVKQSDTTGAFNLIARFQAGGDANETGGAILINHSNDRGLLIEGGRGGEGAIADDDAVSHFGLIQSNGTNTRVMTLRQKSVSNSTLFGVGIGTTTPQQKLHVEGNIYLGPNNTNNFVHSGANLGLQADGEVKIVSDVNDIAGGGASDIIFGYGSSTDTDSNQDFTEAELSTYPRVEVMRIDVSTNRVGIGTATPQQSLSVDGGNIGLGLGAEVYGIIAPNNTNYGLDFIIGDGAASGDTPIMSLKSNGGQPEGTVQIYGSGSTVLDIQGTSGQLFSITDDLTGDLFTVSDISGVPIFNVNASGTSYFDDKVGIGTTSPSTKLHVEATTSPQVRIGYDANNYVQVSVSGTGDATIAPTGNGIIAPDLTLSAGSAYIKVDAQTSNVGIGTTSPATLLHTATPANGSAAVNNELRIQSTHSSGYGGKAIVNLVTSQYGYSGIYMGDNTTFSSQPSYIEYVDSSNMLKYKAPQNHTMLVGTATKMSMNTATTYFSGNNVGIGTTSPSHQLEVGLESTVALANQPAIPLMVSNDGNNVDGRVFIQVKHDVVNTAGAIAAGFQMTAAAVSSGTPSYFSSLMFLESAHNGSDTVHSAPKAIKFYVDNHDTAAGVGTSYGQLGDFAMIIAESTDVGIGDDTPSYKLDVAGTIRATGDVIAFSDRRVKENIKTIENASDKVLKLRGVEYNKIGETKKSIGVIAQEIEEVLPEVVSTDTNGMKSVAYGNITGVLIEAIKELKAEIEELKKQIK